MPGTRTRSPFGRQLERPGHGGGRIAESLDLPASSLCQACINTEYPTATGRELYQIDLAGYERNEDRDAPAAATASDYQRAYDLGVRPGNFTHCTELFGPVLSVIEAEDLAEAVDIVNQTGFGLTSGIESLDETEIEYWTRHIRAGNLYINRVTTGAIVQRQPFGGMGKSAIGPGIKVGGPNYVQLFMDKEEVGLPTTGARAQVQGDRVKRLGGTLDSLTSLPETQRTRVRAALTSQDYEWTHHFRSEPDHSELRGEENFLRYLPLKSVLVVWAEGEREDDLLITALAALRTGTRVHLCATTPALAKRLNELSALLRWQAVVVPYPNQLPAATYERIRFLSAGAVSKDWRAQAAELGYYIATDPVLADGRLELLNYTKEQSISYAYHRFGNISGWASLRD